MRTNKFRKPRQDGKPGYLKSSCCLWQLLHYTSIFPFVKENFHFFQTFGQVFLVNFSLQRGQVMAILPFPLGTRTICLHLGQR